jgi:hypothetical protein
MLETVKKFKNRTTVSQRQDDILVAKFTAPDDYSALHCAAEPVFFCIIGRTEVKYILELAVPNANIIQTFGAGDVRMTTCA